jgi:hypothetical protein
MVISRFGKVLQVNNGARSEFVHELEDARDIRQDPTLSKPADIQAVALFSLTEPGCAFRGNRYIDRLIRERTSQTVGIVSYPAKNRGEVVDDHENADRSLE